ncbi:LacI family DNA-binding transcriptional regulator [Xanthomonas melonis]|uniref:LacI family DNA-binding transcriptional regulator n=1 Tax=Xanthomonas melonis TaxID=56456 RepID=A0ABS8NZH1_9XANT|nr:MULTISPECIES: LacI family DNA-binding transcriptional regulator [Xanthomonas]MCC4589140.1 LacI family transcriptional regulator [Xanthomonas sp. NCPPB 1067]MCD0248113.1 LacI family DNA-binding transcriptional regulator [Xanthomonas melonis]MCD0259222.1 LacI family DNA-binding transcriptional regulator [Xanthomonas melonis]MCD0267799.1 LacI family DNA-binding transcriptional regulator [Xanthomonas melonis]MCD0278849.1 LacI family DNA-binding transcriptional regulator [Xanthomonas melonis]
MAKGAVTIKDVAREAQVSVATVSRALNGHDNVAGPVREQVVQVARRLRYSPHAAARSLSSRCTQTMGVVLPDLYGEFFSELIRGIDGAARAAGRHLLVSSYHGDPEAQGRALRAMRGRVDGLLVLSPYAEQPGFLTDNLPQALPTVLINAHLPGGGYPVLSIDDHAGAVAMTEHLLRIGHRRIAFIGGPALNFDARERLRGFRDAMAAAGSQAQGVEYPGDFDEASGHRAGLAMLAEGTLPDAVFAANDMAALGCLYAFAQAGIRVPADVALAGFDDIPLARFVHPALTTMRVSIARLGEQAMARLLRLVEAPDHDYDDGGRRLLAPELAIRASCGAGAPGA